MGLLKKCLSVALSAGIAMSAGSSAVFAESEEDDIITKKGIVILHVTDVHSSISSNSSSYGYAELAAYKTKLEGEGYTTILVDAGDFSRSETEGKCPSGEDIVDIMNELDFDVASLGEHEFDDGVDELQSLLSSANFTVVSSNFVDESGVNFCEPWTMVETDTMQIAFVGITTPETITDSNYMYFQNDDGSSKYNFCGGNDGADLYNNVQASVDAAKEAGADIVIALSHLGTGDTSKPWRSTDVIANTTGIDIVIDGHSHSKVTSKDYKNKDGNKVILTSSANEMKNIGKITIAQKEDEDGNIISSAPVSNMVSKGTYVVSTDDESDEYYAYSSVQETVDSVNEAFKEKMDNVAVNVEFELVAANPKKASDKYVKYKETNLGDLFADAYKDVLNVDVAMVRGADIAAGLKAGEVNYSQLLTLPASTMPSCVIEATGQEILDALELSNALTPEMSDNYVQVSGITYELHTYLKSSVKLDSDGKFAGVEGNNYRVKNVMIDGQPMELEGIYTVASDYFTLKGRNTVFTMFADNDIINNELKTNRAVLEEYLTVSLGGFVSEEYQNPDGSGRVVIRETDDTKCGDNVSWNYDDESGKLVISGSGEMFEFDDDNMPWNEIIDDIIAVEIIGDVTVQSNAFKGCDALEIIAVANDDGEAIEYIVGDVSKNGKIDLQDAIKIAKARVGVEELSELESVIADYNHSGKVDLQDAIGIAKYILNKGK